MALIIVESPTKARTFNRILKQQGRDGEYFVYATMGHIRDLPGDKISIDYTHNFKPDYAIIKNKQKVVDQLESLKEKNKEIILATDPDREGESISYHVAYILGFIDEKWPDIQIKSQKSKVKSLKRIVFHEITARALEEALKNPEELRINLVKAQQGRRILDRIVGYELSPLLWKKMGKNWLSAGRVQTVALRLIVEREKEIREFKIEDYFQLTGNFSSHPDVTSGSQGNPDIHRDDNTVQAKLVSKESVSYEVKTKLPLFDGEYEYVKTTIDQTQANSISAELKSDTFKVLNIEESTAQRFPPPPFTTSLLQQEAFHRFNFSSKQTMRLAQDLYERGLISYHRTDSFNLSSQFVFRAKDYISTTFGAEYALEKPRGYRTKSKMAQEAHEAIRPTKVERANLDDLESERITQNHKRLYKLIHDRALATQMKEAQLKVLKITLESGKKYQFESNYEQVIFDGFLKLINPDFVAQHSTLPTMKIGSDLNLHDLLSEKKQTRPPYRYNDATLIRALEEKGIGRPSTYAPIISLIQEKNYVEKQGRYFSPTKLGEAISEYMSKAFPDLFSLDFTAAMENTLDQIAEGTAELVQVLRDFYEPFHKQLEIKKEDKEFIDVEDTIDETCPQCGSKLAVRFSKFGKFLACTKYPDCKFTKPFLQYLNGKACPLCGGRMAVRYSRSKKRFYGCGNYPTCKFSAWTIAQITNPPPAATTEVPRKKVVEKKTKA